VKAVSSSSKEHKLDPQKKGGSCNEYLTLSQEGQEIPREIPVFRDERSHGRVAIVRIGAG
jgi:hypothetical protein